METTRQDRQRGNEARRDKMSGELRSAQAAAAAERPTPRVLCDGHHVLLVVLQPPLLPLSPLPHPPEFPQIGARIVEVAVPWERALNRRLIATIHRTRLQSAGIAVRLKQTRRDTFPVRAQSAPRSFEGRDDNRRTLPGIVRDRDKCRFACPPRSITSGEQFHANSPGQSMRGRNTRRILSLYTPLTLKSCARHTYR